MAPSEREVFNRKQDRNFWGNIIGILTLGFACLTYASNSRDKIIARIDELKTELAETKTTNAVLKSELAETKQRLEKIETSLLAKK